MTPAESRFWKLLSKIEGFHFRKQTPVGPHVFDFGDLGRRLLIEVDGGIHDLPEVQERDRAKDLWATSQGFVVLRIPNQFVFGTGEPLNLVRTEVFIDGTYGRLRDVIQGSDGFLYLATSNRDGRGEPGADDDRVLRLMPR